MRTRAIMQIGRSAAWRWLFAAMAFMLFALAEGGSARAAEPLYKALVRGQVNQVLDYSNPGAKFKQRYFIISDFVTGEPKQASVLYYICDHGPCTPERLPMGAEQIAKMMGAHIVALEMRYRGESQPFQDFSPQSLKYLKFDYILEDLAVFQKQVMSKLELNGRWFTYGGSYAGLIASAYQVKMGNLISATIASSAPIIPMLSYEYFDDTVTAAVGAQCTARMKAVLDAAEGSAADLILSTGLIQNERSVATELAQRVLYYSLQASRIEGRAKDFCDDVIRWAGSANDLAYGVVKQVIDQSSSRSSNRGIFGMVGASTAETYQSRKTSGYYQWDWQVCNELGWFQVAAFNGLAPKYYSTSYFTKRCKKEFGVTGAPDPQRVLGPYVNPILNGQEERILFINFKSDPWYGAGINGLTLKQYPKIRASYFDLGYGHHARDLRGLPQDENLRLKIVQFLRRYIPPQPGAVAATAPPEARPRNFRSGMTDPHVRLVARALGLTLKDGRHMSPGGAAGSGFGITVNTSPAERRPLVTAVTTGGAAAQQGLKVHDVLLDADGQSLATAADLARVLQERQKAGQTTITLSLWAEAENGGPRTVTLPLQP